MKLLYYEQLEAQFHCVEYQRGRMEITHNMQQIKIKEQMEIPIPRWCLVYDPFKFGT